MGWWKKFYQRHVYEDDIYEPIVGYASKIGGK